MYKSLIIVSFFLYACSENTEEKVTSGQLHDSETIQVDSIPKEIDQIITSIDDSATSEKTGSKYSSKVQFKEDTGWGYQIFEGSKLLINQEHIPAIQGIQGFSTKKKAEKTAQFVLDQIDKGNFPPTLSKEILDSLGVL